MKNKKFVTKTIVLSSVLIIFILCSTIIISGMLSGVSTGKNIVPTTAAKEIDLEDIFRNFDKIDDANVNISSDDKISQVNIFFTINEKLSDTEIDNVVSSVLSIVENSSHNNIEIKDHHGDSIYPNVQ